MAYDKNFCDSPQKPIAEPPSDYKGGKGTYDGETGYPKRTSSPNAAPEKVRDGSMPNSPPPTGAPSQLDPSKSG